MEGFGGIVSSTTTPSPPSLRSKEEETKNTSHIWEAGTNTHTRTHRKSDR